MTVKIDGTNTVANPAFTGADTDTGLQCGTDELKLVTGGTARATVDSSGRLLLGTTTEGYSVADNLTIADSSECGMTIRSGTSSSGSIYFSDATSGGGEYDGYIEYSQSSRYMRFGTAQNERMRILSSGGLTFNGDTAAANALDDYEEGTWTPTPYLSYNPSGRVLAASGEAGRYTKIGQIVHVWFGFNYSINGSGAFNLGINNLPFTIKDNAGFSYNGGGSARESQYTGYMFFVEGTQASTTRLSVIRRYDNGSPRDPAGTLVGHLTYEAA